MKEFHAHLDVCKRCASQPFNLCPIGAMLMQAIKKLRATRAPSSRPLPAD